MDCWLRIVATTLLIKCSSFDIAEAVCVNTAVSGCLYGISQLYVNSPVYEADVAIYCSNVNQMCSSTLTECGCTTGNPDEHTNCLWFIGFKSGLAYACSTDNTRSVFLRYRECIVVNDQKQQVACIKGEDCLTYDESLRCYYYAMKTACNIETASLMTHIQQRRYQPAVGNIGCTLHLPSEVTEVSTVSRVASVASNYRLDEVLVVAVLAFTAAPKFLLLL